MNITTLYKTLTLALALLVSTGPMGCKKDDNKSKKADGVVLDFGNIKADGCGWVIRIDQIDYSPQNLDEAFKQDNLNVTLTYDQLATRFQCGLAANIGLPQIKVNDIRQVNKDPHRAE
ncbi:hypothetical protein DJ568_08235 [Mucilaginibacter hurinus]|uniref:Uncharacterized protein n=1 Tax=Mucilaginibacter hurinus TaxID=2201324 RepID=A0A367GNV8_9SPHI|nr:hypothetical protein [Mucilaginibacter hurinus]RCH55167.1 hypothetical protein DJ568_08235 [Mucilaginibacter hurinus]